MQYQLCPEIKIKTLYVPIYGFTKLQKNNFTITLKLLPASVDPLNASFSLIFWLRKCFYAVHGFFDILPAAHLLTFQLPS